MKLHTVILKSVACCSEVKKKNECECRSDFLFNFHVVDIFNLKIH